MEDIRIKLSVLWVARMLTGFLGDVLRFLEPGLLTKIIEGKADGIFMTADLLFISALFMEIPIIMVVLSITLKYKINRILNIIFAIFFFFLDFTGLIMANYAYAIVVITVGLAFNIMTIWYAWNWKKNDQETKIIN